MATKIDKIVTLNKLDTYKEESDKVYSSKAYETKVDNLEKKNADHETRLESLETDLLAVIGVQKRLEEII